MNLSALVESNETFHLTIFEVFNELSSVIVFRFNKRQL
jgi:hypothetical protein